MATQIEREMAFALRVRGIKFDEQVMFHPSRKWRADFRIVGAAILVECEGLVFAGKGRHNTATGVAGDCEKHNAAVMQGYTVLRATNKGKAHPTAPDRVADLVLGLLKQQQSENIK